MEEFLQLINSYVALEYRGTQNLSCILQKVEGDKLYLMVTRDFEKSGLVAEDEVKCRIEKSMSELNFKAKIVGVDISNNSMQLILTPTTQLEEYINVRSERRIDLRFIAFTDENNLASVVNLSREGMLFSSNIAYDVGDKVQIKLLISYPSTMCNFIGEVVRIIKMPEGRNEYGIRIKQFKTEDDNKAYSKLITELIQAYELKNNE